MTKKKKKIHKHGPQRNKCNGENKNGNFKSPLYEDCEVVMVCPQV